MTVACLAFLAALSPLVRAEGDEAHFVDASLDLDGLLLSWRAVDLAGDARRELALAVRTAGGRRELRIHRMGDERIDPEPLHVVPILEDVLAWGVADVRAEEGRELLFLTANGAWSYSLTLPGYRDNVQPLARTELVYDLPDSRALPFWAYVIPAEGRDLVLLPGRDGFRIWGPSEEGEGAYVERASFPAAPAPRDGMAERSEDSGGEASLAIAGKSPFLREDLLAEAALLSDSHRMRAPALADVDGDGDLEVVLLRRSELAFHDGGPLGPPAEPTRREALPDDLVRKRDRLVELALVDVDADGDLDVLAHAWDEIDGFENAAHRILVYRNDGGGLLSNEPDQVLRFEAAVLRHEVADVDADGRPDLVVRQLVLPSLAGAVTGLEFTFGYLLFPGGRDGFARRPALKQEETYDEETITEVAANRTLAMDCSGDGVADLVELDVEGRIAVRRVRRESSLLRGERWTIEAAPWKRFDAGGRIESLHVEDLNGDGLGDVVSAGGERLTVLLSVRPGRRR